MGRHSPTGDVPAKYPERDSVQDLDPSSCEDRSSGTRQPEPRHREPIENQERGNRGPDEQPGFGQGA